MKKNYNFTFVSICALSLLTTLGPLHAALFKSSMYKPNRHQHHNQYIQDESEEKKEDHDDQALFENKLWPAVDIYMPKIDFSAIANKDLVFFLGNAGAGKSTTINILLGHPFSIEEDDDEDKVISTTKNSHINGYAPVGDDPDSVTKVPSLYESKKDRLCYLDCPGFKDTAGEAQAIFNMMVIRSCVQRCRSVKKIVYVIEKSSMKGDRGGIFKTAIENFSKWFLFPKTVLPNIIWLFTKYNKGRKETVVKKLTKICNAKHTPPQVKKLLKEILEKYPNNLLIMSTPVTQKRQQLLNMIQSEFVGISEISKGSFTRHITLNGQDPIRKIKRAFTNLAKVYNIKVEKKKQTSDTTTEISNYKKIIEEAENHPEKIRPQLEMEKVVNEKEMKRKETTIENIKKEIAELNKHGDEEYEHPRTRSESLSARWWGESKMIEYDDDPFIRTETFNADQRCAIEVIKDLPASGKYSAECSLSKKSGTAKAVVATIGGLAVGAFVAVTCAPAAVVAAAATATASGATVVGGVGGVVGGLAGVGGTAIALDEHEGYVEVKFFVKKKIINKSKIENKAYTIRKETNNIVALRKHNLKIEKQLQSQHGNAPQLHSSTRFIEEGIQLMKKRIQNLDKDYKKAKKEYDDAIRKGANKKQRLQFLFYTHKLLYEHEKSIDDHIKIFSKNYQEEEKIQDNEEEKKSDE